jgi:hypothetical protein
MLARLRELMRSSMHFRSSAQRASAEYRYDLCEVLLETVIGKAWERAGEPAVGRHQLEAA